MPKLLVNGIVANRIFRVFQIRHFPSRLVVVCTLNQDTFYTPLCSLQKRRVDIVHSLSFLAKQVAELIGFEKFVNELLRSLEGQNGNPGYVYEPSYRFYFKKNPVSPLTPKFVFF